MSEISNTSPSAPPAGWYPDPQMVGTQRYWDGAAWTENRAPIVSPASHAIGTPAGFNPRILSPEVAGVHTAALVLTLIALLINPACITSILGIIFAGVSISRAKDEMRAKGVVYQRGIGGGILAWAIIITIVSAIFQINFVGNFLAGS